MGGRGLKMARKVLREHRRTVRAAKGMPRPAPWDWARPRLVPLLAGPCRDPSDLATIRARSALGPALVFGVDIGRVYPLVDADVAERWEVSVDQLLEASMANLRARAARTEATCVTRGTMSGWPTTWVETPAGIASSLLLVPDELRRLIGDEDQVIAAPTRDTLIAMPPEVPTRLFAAVIVEHEASDPHPLWLDPFVLEGGELTWGGLVDDPDDRPDDRVWLR